MDLSPKIEKSQPTLITGSSWVILSSFLVVICLILIVWQPLVQEYIALFDPAFPWWLQIDWLLIGIFLFMSVAITLHADLRRDLWLVMAAFAGGFFIESWGTHSGLWAYYTGEQPPLWILPAWPIAALCIDRMVHWLPKSIRLIPDTRVRWIYWPVMVIFIVMLAAFLLNHQLQPIHILPFGLVVVLIFLPTEKTNKLVIFLMGSLLGIFLEYWGTSRLCWSYYTGEIPPLFAIFAHGMASIAFWQVAIWLQKILSILQSGYFSRNRTEISLK
jgi:hypothetical protein